MGGTLTPEDIKEFVLTTLVPWFPLNRRPVVLTFVARSESEFTSLVSVPALADESLIPLLLTIEKHPDFVKWAFNPWNGRIEVDFKMKWDFGISLSSIE